MANSKRGILIAGNWKMNSGLRDTEQFFDKVKKQITGLDGEELGILQSEAVRMWVAPPMTSLAAAVTASKNSSIQIVSQNTHWENSGAYTGEVSGPFLKEIGVSRSLVAHSERRQFFGETDESAGKRTESLLKQEFEVILCVGETREEREANQTEQVLERQLRGAIPKGSPVSDFLDGRLIIAYEPVWAIGTGLTATPGQAEEAHQFIRKWLWDNCGMEKSAATQILYGGSVKPQNVRELLKCPNVDGALVGGASLKPDDFVSLVKAALLQIQDS